MLILFSSGKTIFYERAQRGSKIFFWVRENKIYVFKPPCSVLLIKKSVLHKKYTEITSSINSPVRCGT